MAVVINEPSAKSNQDRPPFWHRSTPRRLVEECGDDVRNGWSTWQQHLARRKRPLTPPFLAGKSPPLWWATRPISNFTLPSINELLSNSDGAVGSPAWLALAAAYALSQASEKLTADLWWELAERLRALAADAEMLCVDRDGDPQDVLRQQLLAGELPLALGYLFPEIQSFRDLRNPARDALSEALVEWTDGQGMLHGRLQPVLGPLWACWTRCRWMGSRLKRGCWSDEAEVQYQWLVRHAIRLTDADGRFLLTDKQDVEWPKGLYKTALEMVGDRADCAAANAIFSKRVVPPHIRVNKRDLPDVSLESEWSGVAVLATDWKRSAAQVAINYTSEPMRIELANGGQRLLDGLWSNRTTCNGEPVRMCGEWEQACWQSDAKCDYLELGAELSHGLRLERQVLLSRTDRLLFLADVVVAADGSQRQLTHTVEVPLAPKVKWQPEKETRDGVLEIAKARAAVLPLALTEWRCDPRGGRLEFADGKLALSQSAGGRAIYCPLLIDLDGRRTKKERTWRPLTVAESLETVRPDVAVGYRAQAGRSQWLFYRSLAAAGNRTLMGQNIAGEFFAGRFHASGKLDEWIEIEASG